jgi:hypothetical protein
LTKLIHEAGGESKKPTPVVNAAVIQHWPLVSSRSCMEASKKGSKRASNVLSHGGGEQQSIMLKETKEVADILYGYIKDLLDK